jgi:hypothetical protein
MLFHLDARKSAAAVLAILAAGLMGANAATVYFNDANRGPSGSLSIGGVTATSSTVVWTNGDGYSPLSTQIGTATGDGLGCTGPGRPNCFNLQFHYAPGESSYDWSLAEAASLTLDNPGYMITGVTIVPHVTAIWGSLDPVAVELPFTAFLQPASGGGPGGHQISSSDPKSFIVSFFSDPDSPYFITSDLTLTPALSGLGDGFPAALYRQGDSSQELVLDYSFTIVSVDYAPIPEPGAASLLLAGLGVFAVLRRKRAG